MSFSDSNKIIVIGVVMFLLRYAYIACCIWKSKIENKLFASFRQTQLLESHVSGHMVKKEVTEEGEVGIKYQALFTRKKNL